MVRSVIAYTNIRLRTYIHTSIFLLHTLLLYSLSVCIYVYAIRNVYVYVFLSMHGMVWSNMVDVSIQKAKGMFCSTHTHTNTHLSHIFKDTKERQSHKHVHTDIRYDKQLQAILTRLLNYVNALIWLTTGHIVCVCHLTEIGRRYSL